jgi:hypothetical protein
MQNVLDFMFVFFLFTFERYYFSPFFSTQEFMTVASDNKTLSGYTVNNYLICRRRTVCAYAKCV